MARKPWKKPKPPLKGKVTVVQGVNPKQCPNHGQPTEAGEPTYCADCDEAVRGTGDKCWRHGEPIATPDPEVVRGSPAPTVVSEPKPFREWRVELPGQEPMRCAARNRKALRASLKKLLQIESLSPGTRITELTS